MRLAICALAIAACNTDGEPHAKTGAPNPIAPSTGGWGSAIDLAKLPGELVYIEASTPPQRMRIANGRREPIAGDTTLPARATTAASPDGATLTARLTDDGTTRLFVRRGAAEQRLTERPERRDEHSPAWSPDGRLVAYVVQRATRQHVWIRDLESRNEVDVTPEGVNDATPMFSPDSRWIVVTRTRGHDVDLWAIPTGVGEPVRVTTGRFADVAVGWQ